MNRGLSAPAISRFLNRVGEGPDHLPIPFHTQNFLVTTLHASLTRVWKSIDSIGQKILPEGAMHPLVSCHPGNCDGKSSVR